MNQFNSIGGIKVGVNNKALSVDHLEVLTDEDLNILSKSDTMPVALPSCSFFLEIPYTNARKLIETLRREHIQLKKNIIIAQESNPTAHCTELRFTVQCVTKNVITLKL